MMCEIILTMYLKQLPYQVRNLKLSLNATQEKTKEENGKEYKIEEEKFTNLNVNFFINRIVPSSVQNILYRLLLILISL